MPPQAIIPTRDVAKTLLLDNPMRFQQVDRDTCEAACLLAQKLQAAFQHLNTPVRLASSSVGQLTRDPELLPRGASTAPGSSPIAQSLGGATHLLSGTISPQRGKSLLVRLDLHQYQANEPCDTLEFRVWVDQLKAWDP